MITEPCDNCKQAKNCNLFEFIQNNRNKMNVWVMDECIRMMPNLASLVSASTDGGKIKVECSDFESIKQYYDYSQLVNSRPKEDDHECHCSSTKTCKSGKGGCGGCSHC